MTTLQEKLYNEEMYVETPKNRVYFTFKNTGIPNNMKLEDYVNTLFDRKNIQLIHTGSRMS